MAVSSHFSIRRVQGPLKKLTFFSVCPYTYGTRVGREKSMGSRLDRKSEEIEELHGRKLTNRQKEFARHYVDGTHSNAECARLAGYTDKGGIARVQAHKLLDPTLFPHVTDYITELREEREKKYGVTLLGQLKRFRELSLSAEQENQFSAAVNAEKIRSSLGGLTIDRRETNHYHAIENMSRDDIEKRLEELRTDHPHAFLEGTFEVENEPETGDAVLEAPEGKDPVELVHGTD